MRLSAPAPAPKPKTPPAAKVGELHAPQLPLWRAFFVFSRKNSEILHRFLENQRKLAGHFLYFVCNYLTHSKIKIKNFFIKFCRIY